MGLPISDTDLKQAEPAIGSSWASLEAYLRDHDSLVPSSAKASPMAIAQFTGGHANLTLSLIHI